MADFGTPRRGLRSVFPRSKSKSASGSVGLAKSFHAQQPGPPGLRPFTVSFLGEGSPTKLDYRKQGTLILTSPLEDLDNKRQLAL